MINISNSEEEATSVSDIIENLHKRVLFPQWPF